MATITLRSIKGSPLSISEMDENFTALNTDIGSRVSTSTYTGADILTKIKTVDGIGSGLDADLLDGLNTSSTNIINSVVNRDGSGNFAAGQITATMFVGSVVVPTTGTVSLSGSTSGSITLAVPATAGTNTITFPAATGNVVTTGDTGTVTNAMLAGSIANSKLASPTATIGLSASTTTSLTLGSTSNLYSSNWVWTGTHDFTDANLTIVDESNSTKKLKFELSGITAFNTRTLTVPDGDGTIAIQSYVQSYVQTAFNNTTGIGFNSQGTKTVSATTPSGGVDGDIWYQV